MAAPAGEEAGGVGAPHPAPHAAAALHAPIAAAAAAAAAAATTEAPAAPGGAAAGVTPPALDPDIAMDHPANQPECADEFGPAPAVAEDDRDDPDNENGGGDNADGTGGGEAKEAHDDLHWLEVDAINLACVRAHLAAAQADGAALRTILAKGELYGWGGGGSGEEAVAPRAASENTGGGTAIACPGDARQRA